MTEIVTQAAAICGLILSIAAIGGLILNAIQKAKSPNAIQNERLAKLEKAVERHEELFKNDLRRFERMEDGNRIMQKCMLALLSHNIDGDDIEEMRKARQLLQEHLINH